MITRCCFIGLLLVIGQFAFACDCPPLKPIAVEQLESYHVIFKGTVTALGSGFALFTVQQVYKGKLTQQVKVLIDDTSSCRITFAKDDQWLIYANFIRYGNLQVDFCSRSRKYFADSTKDYYQSASLLTYESEVDFLKQKLGTQPLEKGNPDSAAMQQHELIQPSMTNKFWLLIGSLFFFTLIIFTLKKFF
jgi:hypothetical protein